MFARVGNNIQYLYSERVDTDHASHVTGDTILLAPFEKLRIPASGVLGK